MKRPFLAALLCLAAVPACGQSAPPRTLLLNLEAAQAIDNYLRIGGSQNEGRLLSSILHSAIDVQMGPQEAAQRISERVREIEKAKTAQATMAPTITEQPAQGPQKSP